MAVDFSLDSSEVSLVSQDGFISRVKKNGEIIHRISFYNFHINSATLCVKNNLLLFKSNTEHVIVDFTNDTQNVIVDVKNPACLNENKKEYYNYIRDYTNDFSKLAIIDDRKNLKIVDRSAKKELYTQDKFYYRSPYFSPGGSIMLINNGKDEARIVYLTTEKKIEKVKHHFSNSALFFSDSSKLLAVEVTYDEDPWLGRIYDDIDIKEEHFNVVETETGKVLAQIKYDGRLKSAKLSLDNNMLFIDSMTGKNERALSIINLQTTKAVSIIKYQNCLSSDYPCAEFLSDASKVFIAYGLTESEASNVFEDPKIKTKSIIRIIDTKAAKEIQKIEYDGLLVNSARLSHDEKALAVSFCHGSLIILDTLMGKEIYRQEGCGCSLPLSFSPDSSIILAYAKETAISIIKRVTCTFDQALVIKYLSWARNNNKTPSDSHFIRDVVNTSEDKDWLNNQLSQKANCIAGSASSKNE